MFQLNKDRVTKDLRTFFYNEISGKTLMSGDFDENSLDSKLKDSIVLLVLEILKNSQFIEDGFKLYDGFVLHNGNCPLTYLQFFNALMKMKSLPSNLREAAANQLAAALMVAPGFAEMLPQLRDFLLGKLDANELRTYFYTSLIGIAKFESGINENNIDAKLNEFVKELIISILLESKQSPVIIMGDNRLHSENCPANYLAFYNAIARLSQSEFSITSPEINLGIEQLRHALMSSDAFLKMLPKLKQVILAATVQEEPVIQPRVQLASSAPVAEVPAELPPKLMPVASNQEVNIDTIRHTFYQYMKDQILDALEKGLIRVDDLESQEPFLYMGLPGLTLLKLIDDSSEVNGFLLANGAIVDKNNCPKEDSFPEFLSTLYLCKERIAAFYNKGRPTNLPEDDYTRIQYQCLGQNSPSNLKPVNAAASSNCAAMINRVAGKISQNANFKKMVGGVIDDALAEHGSKLRM